jgi:acyl carrier protein
MNAHTIDIAAARHDVRAKVVDLASRAGRKKPTLHDDDVIPETGLLDSAGIMEFIVWLETRFDIEIDQGDLTIENFGTVNAIVEYLATHVRPVA